MLLRLEEIVKETQQRHRDKIILLEAPKPKDFMTISEIKHEKFFEPKKVHPKHQKQNKFRNR